MERPQEQPERGLRDHLGVLRRRVAVIVVVTLVTTLVALAASLATPKRYSATAEVLYPQQPPALQDPTRLDANRVMQNEARFVRSQAVRGPVQDRIGSPATVRVTTVRDADSLSITATADTPERAADIANTTAEVYVELRTAASAERATATLDSIRRQLTAIDDRVAAIDAELPGATETVAAGLGGERGALLTQRQSWQRQLDLVASSTVPTIINHASPPSKPSRPATARNVVMALFLGLVLGLAAAYVVDHLDDRIRTVADLRRLVPGLPVIGVAGAGITSPRLVSADDPLVTGSSQIVDVDDLTGDWPSSGSRILVVPAGARLRDVEPVRDVARSSSLPLVGTLFVSAGGDEPAPAADPARP